MKVSFYRFLVASLIALTASVSHAGLTAGARYFNGVVKAQFGQDTPCYVEVLYSPDLNQVTTRSISSLPHLSPSGEQIWIGLGPVTANFLPDNGIYRFQDPNPGAPVKDLVLYTSGQTNPVKLGALYWHAEGGHHDPVFCESLVEATTPEALAAIDAVFATFDGLKH